MFPDTLNTRPERQAQDVETDGTGQADDSAPEIRPETLDEDDGETTDRDSIESIGGDSRDSVNQAGLDIEADDEDQPDSDNPNDVGEDESAG